MTAVFAYARLNARVQPLDRGERYEDPLQAALQENGWAEVTGGGTMQSATGEIEYCGIDLDLHDVERAVPAICKALESCGAPRGSEITFEIDGAEKTIPFGQFEGLGVYLNGTDLPDEVYETCDLDHIYTEINRLLGDLGAIQGYWQGPTETALYLYGRSADEMRTAIADLIANYPLCQKSRIEVIA